jgi:glutamyl-Q tRNA(Asp) synthetase
LYRNGLLYACGCSRKEIEDSLSTTTGDAPAVYPGTCRDGLAPGKVARSFRLRVNNEVIGFTDRAFGYVKQNLSKAVGDFVLKRADGPFAYQLAVVVDDAEQGITDVVRGEDLLDSTPRQLYLQRLLGFPEPCYLHLPIVKSKDGQKLSKQTGAEPLDLYRAPALLLEALAFLGLTPPTELREARLTEIWPWAIEQWRKARLDEPLHRTRPGSR